MSNFSKNSTTDDKVPEDNPDNQKPSESREPAKKTARDRLKPYLPKKEKLLLVASQIFVLIMICGTVWGVLRMWKLPVAKVLFLILMVITAVVFGKIVGCLQIPPLLGMMLSGFLFRNVGTMEYDDKFSNTSSAMMRNAALVVVLVRAGMGICPDTLHENKAFISVVSFVPSLLEAVTSAVCTHFLMDLPWMWAVMVGFLICGVSPAIVVPTMMELINKKLGTDKGIPTFVVAAASVGAIIAITGFGVFFGVIFSTGNLIWTIVKGPLEVFIGITYGTAVGILMWYLPRIDSGKQIYYRVLVLMFSGTAVMFVGMAMNFTSAGSLGCLSLGFVASLRWRNEDTHQFTVIGEAVTVIWKIFEPFLFSLIGREILISEISDNAGYGILCLFIGIAIRFLLTPYVAYGASLSHRERLFMAIAFIPKATLQAALGSSALDLSRTMDLGPEFIANSMKVLTLAVLSILLTAPAGAMLISFTAPVMLKKEDQLSDESISSRESMRTQIRIGSL